MTKLIFGLLLGAVLLYLFQPEHGRERREMLADRLRRGKDVAANRREVMEAGRETVDEARDRARTVAGHAQERFGQTVNDATDRAAETATEARDQARELSDSTRERTKVALNGDKS